MNDVTSLSGYIATAYGVIRGAKITRTPKTLQITAYDADGNECATLYMLPEVALDFGKEIIEKCKPDVEGWIAETPR